MAETVIPKTLRDELKTSYLTYAMSVIVSRAIPDVRDGLKPVHRRILYSMHRVGMPHSGAHKKCATVVGDVLGKYHPHGEGAIYDSLVRMAQFFSMGHVLIDGQGNFGSMDGDMPAAMRYTECRLSQISSEMLRDLDKETVDFQSNFDDTQKEPVVLPSAVPNLLINGGSGIAVGMATNVAPHNLSEVVDAMLYFIDNRETTTTSDCMRYIKGPDFPTGGIIYGKEGIRQGYETGRGIIKVRARLGIEPYKQGQEAIIVTELPYQVNKAELIKRIATLVKNEVLKGISEIRDESDKEGIRVVIELRRDVQAQILLNRLYKHTALEDSFGINHVALVEKSPKTLGLLDIIRHFIAHRLEVETRRIRFELRKAEEKAHLLEGLIKAVDNINEVIKIIRGSKTVDEAKKSLVAEFQFSDRQVNAVVDMRLARLVALEMEKLNKEYAETKTFIAHCKSLLADEEKIYDLIKRDLSAIKDKYGIDRKTEIVSTSLEAREEEDYIEKENMVVSLTKAGYIKRLDPATYKTQHRGGVGIKGLGSAQEDFVSLLFVGLTHDVVMFITNLGKAYTMKVYEVPLASRTAKGSHVRMLLGLAPEEEVQGYITFRDFGENKFCMMATSKGVVKKCHIKAFVNAKKRGIQAINLRDGDTLVSAVEVDDDADIMFLSKQGLALRTSSHNFRAMGRTASGVRGMKLREGDQLICVQKIDEDKELLLVSENGFGKRMSFGEFSNKGRGGLGMKAMNVSSKTGPIASVISTKRNENVLAMTSSGNIIRLDSDAISLYGRQAQGVRMVRLREGDTVLALAVIQENEFQNGSDKPVEAEPQ